MPKMLVELPDGDTSLKKAYRRALQCADQNVAVVVTLERLYTAVTEQLDACASDVSTEFLLEPSGRNTAPAIALAAFYMLERYGSDATLLILPADQLIDETASFRRAVRLARKLAERDYLVLFGIKPTYPHDGYGYIEYGKELANLLGLTVNKFVEKPSTEVAKRLIERGNVLWNSGIFCFKVGTLLKDLRRLNADLYFASEQCWLRTMEKTNSNRRITLLDRDSFESQRSISFDHALLEKHPRVAVVPCDFGWRDIGSWKEFSRLMDLDDSNNRVKGNVQLSDSSDNIVMANGVSILAHGVNNLVIVEHAGHLLVAKKERVDDIGEVKKIVEDPYSCEKKLGVDITERPWGTFCVLDSSPGMKLKKIEVYPGEATSLQKHNHRSEHWLVIAGEAEVIKGSETLNLRQQESVVIPTGVLHRITNKGKVNCVIIETQFGELLEEEDIERFDDLYGRVK